jgi:hypothetical protein
MGPLIILRKYQKKGYGKQLLAYVTNEYPTEQLYIGSSNPAVKHMTCSLGFKEILSFRKLPMEIKITLSNI